MTDLDVRDAFLLEADQRERRRSSCVVAEAELSLGVGTPDPGHVVGIHDAHVRLAHGAACDAAWDPADTVRGRILAECTCAPNE